MRLVALAMGVLVASLTGCTDLSSRAPSQGVATESGAAPSKVHRLPAPPAGTRWLGVNGLMIATPRAWKVAPNLCAKGNRGTIVFNEDDLGCAVRSTSAASVVVSEVDATKAFGPLKTIGTVRGLEISASGLGCRTSQPPICSQSFAVRDAEVMFSITYRATDAVEVINAIRGSIRSIPAGYAAVPLIQFGWSVDEAKQELLAAGLEGRSPEVDWPHYVTHTEPSEGTVLERDAVVDLSIGDG